MDAEDWLRDTEKKLNIIQCNSDKKLRYATYLLAEPAITWWENMLAIQTYVSDSIMKLNRREFENLK
jgi:hypothetical protein